MTYNYGQTVPDDIVTLDVKFPSSCANHFGTGNFDFQSGYDFLMSNFKASGI